MPSASYADVCRVDVGGPAPWERLAEMGSPAASKEVARGRAALQDELLVREKFAEPLRHADPVPGEPEVNINRSLRGLVVVDQLKDAECMELRKKVVRGAGEEAAPGTYRLHADGALEFRVRQVDGVCRWVLVIPDSGGPGQSWRRFIFEKVHAGASGGHKSESGTQ